MWTIIIITIIGFVCFKVWEYYNYWHKRGVTAINPIYTFYNFCELVFRINPNFAVFREIYMKYHDKRYIGLFQYSRPIIVIRDLELIKEMFVRDFDSFSDHSSYIVSNRFDELWEKNLFTMPSKDGWHELRAALSVFFTSSKLRVLYPLMQQVSKQVLHYLMAQEGLVIVDVKDLFSRYANDVIGSAALGVTCDSLENKENLFYQNCKTLADFSALRGFSYIGFSAFPRLMQLLNFDVLNTKITKYFVQLIKETLRYRTESKIIRFDMIHLLMEHAKQNQSSESSSINLPLKSITAEASVFLIAGFETIAYTLSYACYELAANPDVQQRLCKEIQMTLNKYNGNLTYEALCSMEYLDNVISEVLRLRLFLSIIDRKCVKPYVIKPEKPGEKPVHLKEGDYIWIPASAIHRDPQYYQNPNQFNPDRFKSNSKPFTFMPFGVGPRKCVGLRFGLLEIKLVIVEILRNFQVVMVNESPIPKDPSHDLFNFKEMKLGLEKKGNPIF